MKLKLIAIMLFIAIFNCSKYEKKFVTTNGLYIRDKTDFNAEIINVLPIGTEINVLKQEKLDKYQGKEGYWYKTKESEGFVFGTFLNDTRPNGKVTYNLKKSNSHIDCTGGDTINLTLKLSENTARLESDGEGEGGFSQLEIKEGTYSFKDNKLILDLKTSSLEDRVSPENSKKGISISERIELVYNPKLKGFLTEDSLNAINDKEFDLQLKECRYSNEKTTKTMTCPEGGYPYRHIGYFCIR
jgi:hypothetical protein